MEFVDFGNTELVPLSMIRPITNDYVELPILAFKCSLAGKGIVDINVVIYDGNS